jgi:hypothetical protein
VQEREESLADVENYKKKKEAEANKILYTEQFVQLEMAKALSNNTKFFFSGDQGRDSTNSIIDSKVRFLAKNRFLGGRRPVKLQLRINS